MNHPAQSGLALHLGALCCALLWGYSAAPRSATPAAAPSREAAVVRAACPGSSAKPLARTELFFGLARPVGSMISADEFQQFVDREVTPRFPEGLTLLGGDGQFRNAGGATIREGSKVLILLYAPDGDHSRGIEAIRAAYTTAFQQESVMRVDGSACVS